ncbi:MAG: ECF transporter S component [Lachnospiraceae bacterium]|nr:ECF transporter S component [Lachnospiraceae bacterium]
MRSQRTYNLVLTALFAAIIVIMAFTPFGYIPLGFINATIIHIPVILGALFLGPKRGAFLGFIFGLSSMLKATFVGGTLSSFVFSPFLAAGIEGGGGAVKSIIICFVPRILVGVVPYFVFQALRKLMKMRAGSLSAGLAVAGISGALTNTILVMGGIYVLFRDSYATAVGVSVNTLFKFIMGIVAGNGIPEALVAGVITIAVGQVLYRVRPVTA